MIARSNLNLNGNNLPVFSGCRDETAESFITKNLGNIRALYAEEGVVLFRNFAGPDVPSLERVCESLVGESIAQIGLYTDRKQTSKVIYSATIKHKDDCIPMHSENAYMSSFPTNILFYSKTVAESGGRTPLANLRAVSDSVPKKIKDKVREHGVTYVRNIGVLPGQDWRTSYPSFTKETLTAFLEQNNTIAEWKDNVLKTTCRLPGLLKHPKTGEELWFNALYSSSSYNAPDAVREYLVSEFGEDNLPTDTFYGNGESLSQEEFLQLKEAYDSNRFSFEWQADDILLVDNLSFAHGRDSFTADREMYVIQGNSRQWNS